MPTLAAYKKLTRFSIIFRTNTSNRVKWITLNTDSILWLFKQRSIWTKVGKRNGNCIEHLPFLHRDPSTNDFA